MQNKAGANDLPWWFDLYHIAWALSFVAVYYVFGGWTVMIIMFVTAVLFGWLA